MILAFDISSSKVGMVVMDTDKSIKYLDNIRFSSKTSLLRRAEILKEHCEKYLKPLTISSSPVVLIEEPLMNVSGGFGRALTTGMLLRFNGMASRVLHEVFGVEPILENVNHIRSVLGIKIPRGLDNKAKKQIIIDWVLAKFLDVEIVQKKLSQKTKFGNAVEGVDDMADAIVLSVYAVNQNS